MRAFPTFSMNLERTRHQTSHKRALPQSSFLSSRWNTLAARARRYPAHDAPFSSMRFQDPIFFPQGSSCCRSFSAGYWRQRERRARAPSSAGDRV